VKLAVAALLVWAMLGLVGCYYMPGVARPGGTAKASIGVSKSIPAGTMSVVLIVGGPGMDTIANTYPMGTTTATITVPSGPARTFTLLANTPSVTFRDDVTVDLTPGETKSIVLNPVLATSQIIVPDYLNHRLVQIGDMSGTGWTTLSQVAGPVDVWPEDVDFDDQGRVYVAQDDVQTDTLGAIFRVDDITGANLTTTPSPTTFVTGRALAMDRPRGLLYYAESSNIWVVSVSPSLGSPVALNVGSISVTPFDITGLAVDSSGFLYVAMNSGSTPASTVLKIDPKSPNAPVLVKQSSATFSSPYDVLVHDGYVYVTDPAARQIVRLTMDLAQVDSLQGHGDDLLLGPERFVAILNKPITVVDEPQFAPGDRLVAFADMTGAGWTTFGSSGSGQDQFEFYFNSIGS
jgi:hypothetical protein